MKNKLFLTFFCIFFIHWALEKDAGQLKVFSQPGMGGYKSYKAEVIINANIQKVGDWLLDINGHCRWVYNCKSSTKPKSFSQNHFIIRYVIDIPWPVSDREVYFDTNYIEKTVNNKRFVDINMNVIKEGFTPSKGNVQIIQGYIKINLEEIDENTTRLIYIYNLDPAENLSKTLADPFNYRLTYYTMKNLKEKVQK
ncbi:MAG: hypothetical protein KatS3mg129_2778 [Leptospiraceae bacterium]|nr:MAG: hypothetical protein KatS3mg129_2778 [Leptospiraceae bacterium]